MENRGMITFSLTENTKSRLRTIFQEFQHSRETISALLLDYVAEYIQFQGKPSARQEYLE